MDAQRVTGLASARARCVDRLDEVEAVERPLRVDAVDALGLVGLDGERRNRIEAIDRVPQSSHPPGDALPPDGRVEAAGLEVQEAAVEEVTPLAVRAVDDRPVAVEEVVSLEAGREAGLEGIELTELELVVVDDDGA